MKYGDVSLLEEPEIGAVVAVGVNDFFSVEMSDFHFEVLSGCEEAIKQFITLLRYEGNGEFIEMYTGKSVHFAPIIAIEEEEYPEFVRNNSFDLRYGLDANLNCVQFYKQYEMLKENPLLIGNFESLNEEIIKTIEKQEASSSYISSMLDNFCMGIARRLENAYNKGHQEELCLAYGENIVYDFQHGIRRAMKLEKKEISKQEDAE